MSKHANSKCGRIREMLSEMLSEREADGMLPTTARILFYELEGKGLATKKCIGEDGRENPRGRNVGWPPGSKDITDELTAMRDEGVIPWEWIVDAERHLSEWQYFDSIDECVNDSLDFFRLNPWKPHLPPMVLTESKSNAKLLEKIVSPYQCPITGLGGHSHGHLRTVIAPKLAWNGRAVLYLGDHDHCGHVIEEHARRVLEDEIGHELNWTRIGLTEEQVQERGLEPIRKIDERYGDKQVRECWECEALGQKGIFDLMESSLAELLSAMCRGLTLNRVHDRENRQRRAGQKKWRAKQ
jgi:hypothetical protein